MTILNIALLQAPLAIGNPMANAKMLDNMIKQAIVNHADLIVTPECALSGYLPEDILFRNDHQHEVIQALQYLLDQNYQAHVVIGYPHYEKNKIYNKAIVIYQNQIITSYDKQSLPNYQVFDERRYFSPGHANTIFELNGINIGLFICEDLWDEKVVSSISSENIQLVVSLNASPYYAGKPEERLDLLTTIAKQKHLPIAYVNWVGAQDSLLFDGGSAFINNQGKICQLADDFKSHILFHSFNFSTNDVCHADQIIEPADPARQLITAITVAIKEYVSKNKFHNGVLIALSGGIDSAVTLSLAVNALGPALVEAVYMPSQYNADMSAIDAKSQASALGVKFSVLPIEHTVESINQSLEPFFHDMPMDITEENIQARIRGLFIMALSNKYHKLVLTTGNKSEYAVGYATLYGDMCGGYAPLKDVYKTDVYLMAHELNKMGLFIPERVITREPSAELSPNQFDSQSLPIYAELDTILKLFIEEDLSITDIEQVTGYPQATIEKVVGLVIKNEHKRQQSAPGPRVTKRAFGKDRRYPISLNSEALF